MKLSTNWLGTKKKEEEKLEEGGDGFLTKGKKIEEREDGFVTMSDGEDWRMTRPRC